MRALARSLWVLVDWAAVPEAVMLSAELAVVCAALLLAELEVYCPAIRFAALAAMLEVLAELLLPVKRFARASVAFDDVSPDEAKSEFVLRSESDNESKAELPEELFSSSPLRTSKSEL